MDAYLDDLRTLTAIDSGRDHKAGGDQINDWLIGRLRQIGCEIERYPQHEVADNFVAKLKGDGSGRILLLGHSDTVFAKGTAAERPLIVDGNKVLAPGSCDMKAGLLSGLYALEAIVESGDTNLGSIDFLCVSDEESELRFSISLIGELSIDANTMLTLEGVRWLRVEAFGRSATLGLNRKFRYYYAIVLLNIVLPEPPSPKIRSLPMCEPRKK